MSEVIASVVARRVWDSRGRPTLEVEIHSASGHGGRAMAPAGASTGSGEAFDRRDGGAALGGMDVRDAVAAVNGEIAEVLRGRRIDDQMIVDRILIDLDGTANKSRLGGNALIATSMAFAHLRASVAGQPLWRSLAGEGDPILPLPEIQLFGGGAHARNQMDIQDYMVVPIGAATFAAALEMTAEVYMAAGKLLDDAGTRLGVADEGGYWPCFDSNEAGLEMTVRAIEKAGFTPGVDIAISLDIAASEFGEAGLYHLQHDNETLDTSGMIAKLLGWTQRYPIISIEDPLGEDDEAGLVAFTAAAPPDLQIIGDDYLVTNAARITRAATRRACNAALIKPNQAGTLSETHAALRTARANGWTTIVSARSGETEDTTIVHLAVGWAARQLKVGSFARSERMAKWNEGLRIAEVVGDGRLPPASCFPWGRRS